MNKFWHIFTYELQRNARRGGYLFGTFGLPLLIFLGMVGYHFFQEWRSSTETEDPNAALLEQLDFEGIKEAGYIDLSGNFANVPADVASYLTRYEDTESAKAALDAGEIDVYYIIQPDFSETGEVVLHVPNLQLSLINAGPVEQLFYSTYLDGLDRVMIMRLRLAANFQEFNLGRSDDTASTEDSQMFDFFTIYAFFGVFVSGLMLTNTYLMQIVVEERENRLIEILISSARPMELLSGKILAMSILGLLQVIVYVASGVIILSTVSKLSTYSWVAGLSLQFDVSLLGVLAVYFVLAYFMFSALFAAIGTISGSTQEGSQYVGLFVFPLVLPIYFFPVTQADPNGIIPLVLSIFPLTAPSSMLVRWILGAVPLWQLGLSWTLLLVTVITVMWACARLFRVQTLLAGQKPKFRDLPKLIWGAETMKRS